MGRVYAVASGKGGVGKTTTTANLGAALAAAGHETVVVDADLGMANLGRTLGVTDEGPTIHDVLAGEAEIEAAVREAPAGPAVVPGSSDLDAFADASPEELADVLDTLSAEYEYVVVDTGAGLSTDSLAPLRAADEVVLVSTPDPAALEDTEKTATVTRRLGTPIRGLVVVRARDKRAARVREQFDGDVLETIPEDPAVADAVAAGRPLAEHAPRSPATGAYRRLAATLTGVDVPEEGEAGEDETAGADAASADETPGATGDAAPATADAGGAAATAPPDAADERADADETADVVEDEHGDAVPAGADDAAGAESDGANAETATEVGAGRAEADATTSDEREMADEGRAGDAPDAVDTAEETETAETANEAEVAEGGEAAEAADAESELIEEAEESEAADAEDESDEEDAESKGFLSRLFG